MSILDFFTWCENSALGEAIRASRWLFPAIESLHLLGLAMMGGVVLLVNLSLMGFAIGRKPAAQLWRDTWPFLVSSLAVNIVTGLLLFTSEAIKLYYHEAFWVKMTSLLLASLFQFTVLRRVALSDPASVGPLRSKAAALISILLWSLVGAGGRWIGFS